MIRILLVDDQALLCEVLKTWLEEEEDFQVIGVANNGKEGLSKIEMLQPDVVLMDIDMPEMDGLNAAQIVSERFPDVKVIFLSGHEEDDYLGKSLRTGAKGYLLKNTTAKELADKIRYVYNSNSIVTPGDRDNIIALQTQLEELMETYRHRFQKQLEEAKQIQENLNLYTTSNTVSEEKFQQLEQSLSHQQQEQWTQFQEKIRQQLEESKKHQEAINLSAESNAFNPEQFKELEDSLLQKQQERWQKLQGENQSSWESVKNEITAIQNQLNNTNRNLTSQVNQQIVNLKKDLDTQLGKALEKWEMERSALQEWAVQRDEMQPSLQEIESKYREQLKSTIDPICTSFQDIERQLNTMRNSIESFESKHRQELISVANPIRTSIKDLDQQLQKMRNWLVAAVLLAAVALSFSSWTLVSTLNNNLSSDTKETVNNN